MEKEKYTKGQQPCKEFNPQIGEFGYLITHVCWCGQKEGKNCDLGVSFCLKCSSDHHENGYEHCVCKGKGFNK